jgi:tetratricopeptide (TPR) repeat protein
MNLLASALVISSAFSLVLPLAAETDLNQAKALFFDRKYEESRAKWAEIAAAKGPSAEAATYWIARCSDSLGDSERAFREYGAFLDLPPADARLAEEAEISRIGLATKLARSGKPGFLTAVIRSLGDDRAPVRYFGALQVGSLPNLADARKATAVLREIVTASKDPDLVERAKLQLLRIEPRSLGETPPVPSARPTPAPPRNPGKLAADPEPQGPARLLRIRISKGGKQTVAVTVPFSLAEFVFSSLPDATKRGLQLKGYDAEGFWKRLRSLNIREIVSIVGEDGETIEIWVE